LWNKNRSGTPKRDKNIGKTESYGLVVVT